MSQEDQVSQTDADLEPEAQSDHPADVVGGGGAPDELHAGRDADDQSPDALIDSLRREREDLFARLQRVSADFQNFQRRSEQNLADSVNFARGDLLRNFIPVVDHFDNALTMELQSEGARALREGMKIVRDELLKALQQAGVERIEVNTGDPFDPHFHEAMLRQPAEGVEPNHVTAVLQPGYVYRGRTLRPAKVAVAPAE